MLKYAALAIIFGLGASDAYAQSQSPSTVMTHFRAYQAAVERGDLINAEIEASAALDASIARSGDGGNTGALAINLAQTRLELGKREEAYAPAMRAFVISSSGDSALDPLLARLVLGRAELTADRWRQGSDRLQTSMQESRLRPNLNAETYAAATDLGRFFFSREQFAGALESWSIAKEMADAAPGDNHFVRAEARMGHAAALFTRAMESVISAQARPSDTRLNVNANRGFEEADDELLEAQSIIGPFAFTPAPDGGVTVGQSLYGSAVAWRALLRAFASSRGLELLGSRRAEFEPDSPDPRPDCLVRIVSEPRPNFPTGAASAFAVGAVVVRFSVDESGNVTDRRVVASIPDRWFRDSVEQVAPQWSLERLPESDANCRFSPIEFMSLQFYFR